MTVTTQKNSHILTVVLLLVVGFACAYLWQSWSVLSVHCYETGDYAANALQVEHALDFEETSGPYSRYKFRHPGPTIFYLRAIGENILSPFGFSPFTSHVLTQFVINLLLLVGILLIIARHFQSSFAVLTSFFLFTWPLTMGVSEVWSNTWGPFVVVLPVVAALVGAASFSAGNVPGLYLFFVSSLLAVHTHVGTAVVVLPALLLILFALVKRYRMLSQREQKHVRFTSIFYVIFAFLPALLNLLLYGKQGGFYRLLSFFLRRSGEHSSGEALLFLMNRFMAPLGLELSPTYAGGLLLALAFCMFVASDLNNFFARAARWLVLVVFVLGIFSLRRVTGELMPYLAYFYSGVACLGLALPFAWGAQRCEALLKRQLAPFAWKTVLVLLTLGVSCAPVFWGVRAAANPLCNERPKFWYDALDPQPQTLYVLTMGETGLRGAWDVALAVGLELKRERVPFCVPSRLRYLFGDRSGCSLLFDELAPGTHVSFLNLVRTKSLPQESPYRAHPSAKGITFIQNAPVVWKRWGKRWEARWGEKLHFAHQPETKEAAP